MDALGRSRRTRAALLLVVAITLWAGLHPFDFAVRNDVTWTPAGDGLHFGPHSMAVTATDFAWDTASGPAELGLEFWLAPDGPTAEDRDILLILDDPQLPALRIIQAGTDLVVASRVTNQDGERWYNDFRFLGVMAGTAPRHIALTSGTPHPLLSLDGQPVRAATGYGIPLARQGAPLRGRLLIASDPSGARSWTGTLHGLLIHDRALSPAELAAPPEGSPAAIIAGAATKPHVHAAYAFTESHNAAGIPDAAIPDLSADAIPLLLPAYHRPVGTQPLGLSRHSPLANIDMLIDAAVNVAGLIPFGLLLTLVLAPAFPRRRALLLVLVILAGASLSLTIESLQALMPTRHSSRLDLALNTLGAGLGASALVFVSAQTRLRR